MLEALADLGRDDVIVPLLLFLPDHRDQTVAEAALVTGEIAPALNLTLVVIAATAEIEATVPHEPTVRVDLGDPAR